MDITELLDITQFKKIISDFGKSGKIFQSEAQFQFDLAWKINEILRDNDLNDFKVCLEYLSAENSDKNKRMYTDILLYNETSKEFIPIELKYKTASGDFGGIRLTHHGACDLGRFDFLWDVQRIHILKNRDRGYRISENLGKMLFGYAVLLTNDKSYWEVKREDLKNKDTLYKQFCIGDNQKINGEMSWKAGKTCITGTWREQVQPLRFDSEYTCEWNEYYVDSNTNKPNAIFKSLVLKVE